MHQVFSRRPVTSTSHNGSVGNATFAENQLRFDRIDVSALALESLRKGFVTAGHQNHGCCFVNLVGYVHT